jgi:hypothetical protein
MLGSLLPLGRSVGPEATDFGGIPEGENGHNRAQPEG